MYDKNSLYLWKMGIIKPLEEITGCDDKIDATKRFPGTNVYDKKT